MAFRIIGAAERMALSFVRTLGEKREEWAMTATGYIVSIPIFCDSAFVILSPLVRALSQNTGKSLLTLGISLAEELLDNGAREILAAVYDGEAPR